MVCWALVGVAEDRWRGLVVAPEERCAPYDRTDYRYPRTVEGAIVRELGDVYGPYSCTAFASTRETEIEHMIALSEAHDSGLCAADRDTRRRFARDLLNLTVAAPTVNRSKAARDAADWLPDSNRCWFAGRVVGVRRAYGLTVDHREAQALEAVLSGCSAADVRHPFCAAPRSILRFVLPVLRQSGRPRRDGLPGRR